MNYNLLQWISFFFIYSFFGWCIESSIVSFEKHKLINRGFLKSPILPLYGSGAVMLLAVTLPFKYNVVYVYMLGMISATILEYIVGTGMENIFKMKYWDYSNDKFNYKGRICLVSSLFWGFLSVLLVEVVHEYICYLLGIVNINILKFLITIITAVTVTDMIYSIRNAIDIPKVLEKIALLKKQIENVYEEIDILLENAAKDFDKYTDKEELNIIVYNTKQKLLELKEKVEMLKEGRKNEILKINMGKLRLINNNPTASSEKFNDVLKEIRSKIYNNYEEHVAKIVKKISLFQKRIEEIIHGSKKR